MKKLLVAIGVCILIVLSFFIIDGGKNIFLRDDNAQYFLSAIKTNYIDVFVYHQIPQINQFQLLGDPIITQGQTAVFYPIRYISYWFALKVLGNDELVIFMNTIIHSCIAAFGMFLLARKIGFSHIASIIGGYFYSLNGFIISAGSYWMMVPEYAAWLPFIILATIRIARREKYSLLQHILLNIILICIGHLNFYLYITYIQIVIYLILRKKIKAIAEVFIYYVFIFCLCSFQLIPIVYGFVTSERVNDTAGLFQRSILPHQIFFSFIFPPSADGMFGTVLNHLIHANGAWTLGIVLLIHVVILKKYIFTIKREKVVLKDNLHLILLAFLFSVPCILILNSILIFFINILLHYIFFYSLSKAIKNRAKQIDKNLYFWIFLFLLCALLSLGPFSLISYLLYPFIFPFRFALKWYLIAQLFMTVVALFIIEYSKKTIQKKYFITWTLVIMAVFCILSKTQLKNTNPYVVPPSNSLLLKLIEPCSATQNNDLCNSRIIGVYTSTKPAMITNLIGGNFSTFFSFYTITGYNSFRSTEKAHQINVTPEDIATRDYTQTNSAFLQQYGTKYYIYNEKKIVCPKEMYTYKSNENVLICIDPLAKPLVYHDNTFSTPLTFISAGNKILINKNTSDNSPIIVGMYYDTNWHAYINSREVKIEKGPLYSIKIPPIQNNGLITLVYRDKSLYLGSLVSFITLLLVGLFSALKICYKASTRTSHP